MSNGHKNARSIRVFLPDGDADGRREAELTLSTTWAMAFKRRQFSSDRRYFRKKIQRPGLYILLDVDDSGAGKREAYIGESEEVCTRLEYWLTRDEKKNSKLFWEDTIVLSSKDENLTKSHVRYVESRLIAERRNPRWERKKQNQPSVNAGLLPLPDRCDMDKFVEEAKMLVGVLGCDIFRPVLSRDGEPDDAIEMAVAGQEILETFSFKLREGFDATMRLSESGLFVVQKGSKARIKEVKLQEGYKGLRNLLLEDGVVHKRDGYYEFVKDYGFQSPTAAASVVGGGNKNGRKEWKLADGTNYGDWEAAKSDKADGSEDA